VLSGDSKLVERCLRGDDAAWEAVVKSFGKRIYNLSYRYTNRRDEAEDLTQETFVTVYQKLESLKDDAKFEPWLFRIARNYVYQKYRRRVPPTVSVDFLDEEGRTASELADERKDPQEEFQAEELDDVVREVVLELPEKYREVFVLSAIQDLSYQEIAEIVGRSLASVKTDIHRARLQVRKRVKEYLKV